MGVSDGRKRATSRKAKYVERVERELQWLEPLEPLWIINMQLDLKSGPSAVQEGNDE